MAGINMLAFVEHFTKDINFMFHGSEPYTAYAIGEDRVRKIQRHKRFLMKKSTG
jgi:hypothetical protein